MINRERERERERESDRERERDQKTTDQGQIIFGKLLFRHSNLIVFDFDYKLLVANFLILI